MFHLFNKRLVQRARWRLQKETQPGGKHPGDRMRKETQNLSQSGTRPESPHKEATSFAGQKVHEEGKPLNPSVPIPLQTQTQDLFHKARV